MRQRTNRTAAACSGYDPETWFPVSETGASSAVQIEQAKAICAICPLQAACLEWATDRGIDYGIWGGLTPSERRALRPVVIGRPDVRRPDGDHRNRTTLVREMASPV